MAKWYDIDESDRVLAEKQEAWRAYHGLLLKTIRGRELLCDLQRRVDRGIRNATVDPNLAIAQLYLEQFMTETLRLCGAEDNMKLMEARRDIGGSYQGTEEEEPFTAEDHIE